ncbi:MAG: glycosyltransferase family 4 protein [Acidobacteriota bacterium]
MTRRICFVANPAWPHVEKWAKWFSASPDFEVHLLSAVEPRFDGVHWHRFDVQGPSFLPWTIRALRAFQRAYDSIRPDLLHLHNLEYMMLPASLAWGGPTILTTYGLDITLFHTPGSSWKARALKRMVLRRASAVTAASEFLAGLTAKIGGLAPGKVQVTPFGVDTDVFRRSQPRVNDGWLTVGMPKDLKPEYGPRDFIQAIAILGQRGLKVRGFIQGDGPERAGAQELIKELGIGSRMEIRGRVPLDSMREVYESMDVCVLPSLQESFGVAAIEAQSMEVPVVATRVEGLGEVVVDGLTGLQIPEGNPAALADAIEKLAVNPGLRLRMGRTGRDFVMDRFDWRKTVLVMDGLYRRLTASGKGCS